jgi:hypothetical protein
MTSLQKGRAIHGYLSASLVSVVSVTCTVGAGALKFEYAPTKSPLRYVIDNEQAVLIETPMGDQKASDNTNATIVVEIGERREGGWLVSAEFEALSGQAAGVGNLDGADLHGKEFSGTLSQDGTIEITEAPDITGQLAERFDPKAFLADFLTPLPPSGAVDLATWQVRRETVSHTQLTVTSSFVGTALVVGDTTWNGETAKIISATGTFTLKGNGMPNGSPGEMAMVISGEARTRYVWDSDNGVMLGAATRAEGKGNVTLVGMDMSMPMTLTVTQRVELQR